MGMQQKIADIVRNKNTQIPTLPVVVDNVLSAVKDDRTSAKDLAELISKDQAIANKVLRLANSAYYGLVKSVDSISRAITVIGFNEVTSITIGMSVINAFQEKDFHGVLDIRDLWLHSICCAMMTRDIAKKTKEGQPEQYFLTGLLHDMGKVIFAVYFPEHYLNVLQKVKESDQPLFVTEKEILGIDHAGLTGLLMERWNFPDSLIYPTKYHHKSKSCDPLYQHQAMSLELGNDLSLKTGIGSDRKQVAVDLSEVRVNLGITTQNEKDLIAKIKEQQSQIEEFFRVIQ